MFCPLISSRNVRNTIEKINCETDCGRYDDKNYKCVLLTLAELKQKEINQGKKEKDLNE